MPAREIDPHGRDGASDRGVASRAIAWIAVALLGIVAVTLAAVFLWFRAEPARTTEPRPVAIDPGAPKLQTDARRDRAAFDAEKARMLDRTAWVDRDAGVIRIPIERAMRLVVDESRGDPR